ncbi:hypothetical protein STCU_09309 [Strigomonas culicis]|uniref:Tubulin-tyrosine ligase n=1 Tax=Strigomonas culicis TaxID=28005 RepID=S9UYR4_9TRYP|nr:hypothetical protein STCU_09309 [Strigomonas culicis]|eukprot:EPY19751.1 hypothetical protein STCU_09309 [Strigomonas culicis]
MASCTVLDAADTRYHVVRTAATALGWLVVEGPAAAAAEVPAAYYGHPTHAADGAAAPAHVLWLDRSVAAGRVSALQPWQRVNHFAGMDCVARKAVLFKRLMAVARLCRSGLAEADAPPGRGATGLRGASVGAGGLRALLDAVCSMAPDSYSIPAELPLLERQARAAAAGAGGDAPFYIVKPNKGCQGRGIVLTQRPAEVLRELLAAAGREADGYLVQAYVDRPLLIEGKKFDLRLYALLLSVRAPAKTASLRERLQPLPQEGSAAADSSPSAQRPVPAALQGVELYLHQEGLVRICAAPYETPTAANSACGSVHLTNYAVNRQSPQFSIDTSGHDDSGARAAAAAGDAGVSEGNKRDLRFMASFLNERDPALWARVWRRLCSCVALTVLSGVDVLQREMAGAGALRQHRGDGMGCFELLGFDVMLREADAYTPVLMEVNHSPSLFCGTSVDFAIKQHVLTDTLRLVGSRMPDPSQYADGAQYARCMTQQASRMRKQTHALLSNREVRFTEVLPHYRVFSESGTEEPSLLDDWSTEERAQQVGMVELSKLVR